MDDYYGTCFYCKTLYPKEELAVLNHKFLCIFCNNKMYEEEENN